ncbi:MAG: transcriptional regulator [Gammaproteobacteria bacterium]
MVLTRNFRETIQARARRDPRYRRSLLTESVNELLSGDLNAGKAILRDYINATVGFGLLADHLDKSSKSLQRMLGPGGNPTAENIFGILKVLQEYEDIQLQVKSRKNAA